MFTEKLRTDGLKLLCDHSGCIEALTLATRPSITHKLK